MERKQKYNVEKYQIRVKRFSGGKKKEKTLVKIILYNYHVLIKRIVLVITLYECIHGVGSVLQY